MGRKRISASLSQSFDVCSMISSRFKCCTPVHTRTSRSNKFGRFKDDVYYWVGVTHLIGYRSVDGHCMVFDTARIVGTVVDSKVWEAVSNKVTRKKIVRRSRLCST